MKKEMEQVWIDAEADMQKNVTERWKVPIWLVIVG